jgi:hypothetical protein
MKPKTNLEDRIEKLNLIDRIKYKLAKYLIQPSKVRQYRAKLLLKNEKNRRLKENEDVLKLRVIRRVKEILGVYIVGTALVIYALLLST